MVTPASSPGIDIAQIEKNYRKECDVQLKHPKRTEVNFRNFLCENWLEVPAVSTVGLVFGVTIGCLWAGSAYINEGHPKTETEEKEALARDLSRIAKCTVACSVLGPLLIYHRYQSWKAARQFDHLRPLSSVLIDMGELKEYQCLISRALPIDIVVTPNGNFYERSAIIETIRRSQRDPHTNELLTENQLVPARGAVQKIQDVLNRILEVTENNASSDFVQDVRELHRQYEIIKQKYSSHIV